MKLIVFITFSFLNENSTSFICNDNRTNEIHEIDIIVNNRVIANRKIIEKENTDISNILYLLHKTFRQCHITVMQKPTNLAESS